MDGDPCRMCGGDGRIDNALGGTSANVIATLKGTENPEIVYVVSSHYDSNASSPGADDDSSATAALLEAARVLAKRPLPATVIFASFTGEESGLLGSREFVRVAREKGLRIVGALNNDMIGWANDYRLDNTIRYSNAGIRDVQHAASFLTKLITYDARYFKSTDAASYYEAYGDIVGGIGSYPVLGNPHYHQPTDDLTADWDFSGAVEDARLLFHLGAKVADAPLAPAWRPGDEFEAARRKALADVGR